MFNKSKFILVVFIILVIERIIFCFVLPPIIQPDTPSYTKPAFSLIEKGNFGDITLRTPGYPLFLAGIYSIVKSDMAVVVIQHILGLILIFMALTMIQSNKVRNLAALFFLADMHIITYEHAILADFLLTFALFAVIYFLIRYFNTSKDKYILFSGIFLSLGVITKPVLKLYPYMAAFFLILFLFRQKRNVSFIIKKTLPLVLPSLILWFTWSVRNYKKVDYFGLTPFMGIELAGITENFWDFKSPLHADIKKIGKRHLALKDNKRGSVVHGVVSELRKIYSPAEINQSLLEIAKEAILKNPHLYFIRGLRETLYFYLANDSIFTFFSDRFSADSILSEFKKNGIDFFVISKFFLNFYLIWWFALAGFIAAVLRKLKNPKEINISEWLILFTMAYIGGISCFISIGHSRFRTAIQAFIILWSAKEWLFISEKIKSLSFPKKR